MKSFLISDNRDTYVGLKLAGIRGVIVHDKDEILQELEKTLKNKEIGIIIITELILEKVKDKIMELKSKLEYPLIVVIPDRHGFKHEGDFITRYIQESIGLKL